MNLVNKKVMHKTFGKGNVINCDDSYIKINFESGDKRFSFPSAFRRYIKFVDQKATDIVNKELEKEEEELKRMEKARRKEEERIKKEELALEEERAIELEQKYILKQRKRIKSGKINSIIQSVFWCESDEEDEIFSDWKVFTGKIKSGKNKGQPKLLPRMNKNSGCLLTLRKDFMPEADRQILGVFMTDESFDGRICEDGYIKAHPEYRIKLSEEESEGMLFWNYYVDKALPDKTVWNSGRQRYFDNMWMAQILRDIVIIKEKKEEQDYAQEFYDYFCKINFINQAELPIANGPLMNI